MQGPILAVFLLTLCFLVDASESENEPEPTAQAVFLESGTGLYPRQDTFPPGRRPGGLFGWMGSQLSRLPQMFRPRPSRTRQPGRGQQPGRFQPEVVLPDPPGVAQTQDFEQDDDDEATFDDDSQEPNEIDIGAPTHNFNRPQEQFPGPQFFPQQQAQGGYSAPGNQQFQHPPPHFMPPPQLEVVKSQMISYNHHQQPFNLPLTNNAPPPTLPPTHTAVFQNEIPHSQPVKSYLKNNVVPVVPQSTGPDYFDTAYRLQPSSSSQGAQQSGLHVSALKNSPENNYGATFHDVRQGAVNPQGPNAQSYPAGTPPASQEGAGSLFGSIVENTHDLLLNSASSPLPGASAPDLRIQQHRQPYAQHQQQFLYQQLSNQHVQQPAKTEPSVQILSQGVKDGNPVFEVLADADAPLFDGQHPFDINKLIAMIEPGAVVDQPPQLSQASSETQNVYQTPSSFSFVGRR